MRVRVRVMMRVKLRVKLWFSRLFEVQGDVELGGEAPNPIDLRVMDVLADPWWTAPPESMRGASRFKVARA